MEAQSAPDSPQHAYAAVKSVFENHKNEVLEIEILPKAFAPTDGSLVLVDGLCIGIPKAVLVQAFLCARAIFSRRHEHEVDRSSILGATRIILLFDAEHITAANYRKQYLQSLTLECTTGVSEEPLERAIRQEICLLDTLLTSPLHRHTKSPTLWHHRYWLYTTIVIGLIGINTKSQSTPTRSSLLPNLQHELESVFKAGERHPKNYYAWGYARRLINLADQWMQPNLVFASVSGASDSYTTAVHEWCLRHPSDTSGWSFLLFLLGRPDCTELVKVEVVAKTLDFATRLQWQGESLWVFLRTALGSEKMLPSRKRSELQSRIKAFVKETAQESTSTKENSSPRRQMSAATAALVWIERYGNFDNQTK